MTLKNRWRIWQVHEYTDTIVRHLTSTGNYMHPGFSRGPSRAMLLAVLLIAACGSAPTLVSKSAHAPDGLNISGQWVLQQDPAAPNIMNTPGTNEGFTIPGRRSTTRRNRDMGDRTVQVFLELGQSLKITQTAYGLFISYDRSVVEEYTFGENRMITIGPIKALRASGWEGRVFAVETLDSAGSLMRETWELDERNDVLSRNIRMSKGDKEVFSRQQSFKRQ